ncbi:uncharacterized protein LOC117115371 isoform X2 [Anneissia japonica]|uniref:uncharacterized protein LOC117115371 isoform X2 n=1 Tax=Anneissia japonica TaxID=1529436 RepID=UPI0014259883|nr:uncharacterized protein LOC117115371 isoform X2 [Anneissia japonica]
MNKKSLIMDWMDVTDRQTNFKRLPEMNYTDAIDVVKKGCVCDYFSPLACARNGILSFICSILCLLCIVKVIRLCHSGKVFCHQVLIFTCAALECIIITVHWVYIHYTQLEFAAQFLKLTQLVAICHFYLSRSLRLLKREDLNTRLLIPLCLAFQLYFTTVTVIGIKDAKPTKTECNDPYWLMLSTVELVLVQVFLLSGIYITMKLNEVTTLESARRAQKRDLWCIIIVFEMSTTATVIFDSYMKAGFVNQDEGGSCSGNFNHNQVSYSIVYLFVMIFKLVIPILALLIVFHPVQRINNPEGSLICSFPGADDGTFSSRFNSVRGLYRPLYHPESHGFNYGTVKAPVVSIGPRRTLTDPALPTIQESAEEYKVTNSGTSA